jgi:hypothetical protein
MCRGLLFHPGKKTAVKGMDRLAGNLHSGGGFSLVKPMCRTDTPSSAALATLLNGNSAVARRNFRPSRFCVDSTSSSLIWMRRTGCYPSYEIRGNKNPQNDGAQKIRRRYV